MTSVRDKARPNRFLAESIIVSLALLSVSAGLERLSAQGKKPSATMYSPKRMTDGKLWTTRNLHVNASPSYCYEDAERNCRLYGRLYPWESAQRVCQLLGDGWRLPTDEDWRELARHYGGVSQDSEDKGKAAFKALLSGGSSGFNAILGGGRSPDGQYERLEAHGFYWTASEIEPGTGWSYNFGKGGQALHRQNGGEKPRAFSVRCVRE
jgi:uncharacterized protein (TIGR02145 family)